jgi:hypothetical protein
VYEKLHPVVWLVFRKTDLLQKSNSFVIILMYLRSNVGSAENVGRFESYGPSLICTYLVLIFF